MPGHRARQPPPALVQRRVTEYAFLPATIPFKGTSIHLKPAGGPFAPLGRVPRLALCRDREGVWLTFCDRRWGYVASQRHSSIAEARRAAERAYPGCRGLWVKASYSAADVRKYLKRLWGPYRCLFCLKSPLEWGTNVTLLKRNRGRICSSCVSELARDALRPSGEHSAAQQ